MFNGYGRHVKEHAIFEGMYIDDKYLRGQMTVFEAPVGEDLENGFYAVKYIYLGEYKRINKRDGVGLYVDKRGDMYYGYHDQSNMRGAYLAINNDGERFIAFFENNVAQKMVRFEK
jgi:hypothetical protein